MAPNPGAMHLGLWFERFFHGYENDFAAVNTEGRSAWLRQFDLKQVGARGKLQAKAEKIQQLAASQGGQARIYQCTAPFVTGMGNPPLKSGFTWHPTLGMPYLPGSAVKGLVRAAVGWPTKAKTSPHCSSAGLAPRRQRQHAHEASGGAIFLDALPVAPCALVPEVTPHMGKWYEKGGKTPTARNTQPGDWHSPVPVGYLTARDLHLQFAVMPTRVWQPMRWRLVWQALDYALQWLGAGGKTAQGFGTMQSQAALLSQREEKWEGARPKFNRANGSFTVEKMGRQRLRWPPRAKRCCKHCQPIYSKKSEETISSSSLPTWPKVCWCV